MFSLTVCFNTFFSYSNKRMGHTQTFTRTQMDNIIIQKTLIMVLYETLKNL